MKIYDLVLEVVENGGTSKSTSNGSGSSSSRSSSSSSSSRPARTNNLCPHQLFPEP